MKKQLLLVDPTNAGKNHTLKVLGLDEEIWEVRWARSQQTCQELLNALLAEGELPDGIITSLGLDPDNIQRGIELVEVMRKHLPQTPIIVWTKNVSPDIRRVCLNAGANSVLEKYVDDPLLPATFNSLMDRY